VQEKKRDKIKEETQKGRKSMNDKFNSNAHLSFEERVFRSKTVGLVTAEEFKRAQQESKELGEKRKQGLLLLQTITSSTNQGDEEDEELNAVLGGNQEKMKEFEKEQALILEKKRKKELAREKKKRQKMMNTLSFADAEDAQDIVLDLKRSSTSDSSLLPSKQPSLVLLPSQQQQSRQQQSQSLIGKSLKDPTVDTSFLPDKQRENWLKTERQRLKNEWIENQNKIKKELLEITYSYWDGSGHRRTVTCQKGDSIAEFLEKVRKDLAKEFREMNNLSSDALLYVKEDLIIPQDITFYDLIVTKARGKSGPLFNFDVHDDVRVGPVDHRVEKDESHPGKVVERRWYDKNKHIFPASRWEVFDPAKEYGKYTIHGGEVK
jgi:protein FAM50